MAVRGDNSLYFSTGLDNSGLRSGASDAVGIVQNLASSIGAINPFAALLAVAGAAFAKIGNEAYQLAKDFEQAMKEVETISEATQENFDGIASSVFALSKISPDGPVKLAKAYYQIVSAGYDGARGLKLLETATKAATAGVTSTETAADGITTVLNAFKLEAEEADVVADALFQTVKLGKTTFEELSSKLSEVAPLAAASGFSFREVLAAVASLTKQGVPTAQAMTQIRSAIEATSEVLGDGAAKSLTLQNAFKAIYDQAGGSQVKLKKLVGSMEGVSAILATAGPNAEGAAKDLEALGESAGEAERAFNRMAGSNVNEFEILGNRIKSTTEDIGNSLLDISSGLARFLNDALDDSDNLIASVRRQSNEFNILRKSLEDTNVPFEERIEILAELKRQYPEYLNSLDLDKVKNDNLEATLLSVGEALSKINDEQERRLKLSGSNQKVLDAEAKVSENQGLYEDRFTEFTRTLEKIKDYAAKEDIPLNININDDPSKILSDIQSQIDLGFLGEFGEGGQLIADLAEAEKGIRIFKEETGKARKELSAAEKNAENMKRQAYDNADGFEQVSKWVGEIKNLSDLEPFKLYQDIDIQEIVKQREGVIKQLDQIRLADNVESLEPFLNSEIEEVKKFAKERQRFLNTDAPVNPEGDGDALKDLQTQLKETEKKYESYFNLVRQGYTELADKNYASLLKQGEDFEEYLDRRIEAAQNAAEKEALILARDNTQSTLLSAESFGFTGNQVDRASKNKVEIETGDIERSLLKTAEAVGKELREFGKTLPDQLETDPSRSEEEANTKLVEAMYMVADGLYGVADLYYELSGGDEDGANRIAQFAGVAEGAGMIASGNIIGGAMKVLTSAISVEIESSTAKYEEAIARLEKSIEKLDYAISQSTGSERINSRQQAIDQLKEIEEQAKLAEEAEKEAEKQVKVLGLTIAKKGKGSGTDQAKLEELQDKAEEARREVAELNRELNELFTGTTADSITDSIIQGFRDGYTAVEDFASNFEETMKNALLNAFKVKYLEDEVAKFYEQFAEFGEDQNFSAQEISALRELYGAMIEGAESDINAINDILEGSGLGQLGGDPSNNDGLSGGIKGITEDTAAEINGYMNAIRLDVRQGLQVAIQSGVYLSEIAQNTRYNRYLESIDSRMATIENGILEFQSRN